MESTFFGHIKFSIPLCCYQSQVAQMLVESILDVFILLNLISAST
jgi:hypothetical protein